MILPEKYVGIRSLNNLVSIIQEDLATKLETVKVDGVPLEVVSCAVDIDLQTPLSTKTVTVVSLTPPTGYQYSWSIRQNNVELARINIPEGDYEEMSNNTIDTWFNS